MNCRKKITLTGYSVKYADLREAKPRTVCEEVYIFDKDGLDALNLLGLDVADFIRNRYETGGWYVISVERIKPKREAMIDLRQLWESGEAQTNGC